METEYLERSIYNDQEIRFLFVGSPLLDVTAECEDSELLQKYNLVADGCIPATSEHEPLFQSLFHDSRSRMDIGGSALNSARIAKWILGSQEGQVAFAGTVGQDEYADTLKVELVASGVVPLLFALEDYPTGLCVCLLNPGGQRSMCTRHGASAYFSKDHLSEKDIVQWFTTSQIVFVVGYFAKHSPDAVVAMADQCLPNQLFSISLSAEYVCRNFSGVLLSVMPRVDIVFANEVEICAFAETARLCEVGGRLSAESATKAVASIERTSGLNRPRIVVVTRGPQPVILVEGADDQLRPRYFPVPEVPVLDSVGCGDALAGAFLAVYALTRDGDRAVKAGIEAAAVIAQVPGCCPPLHKKLTF